MTTDAENRFELFEFLRDTWGPTHAGRLMDLLPPAGANELATKEDVAVVRADVDVLRADMAVLHADMGALRADMGVLRADMNTMGAELRADMGVLRADMNTMGAELRADMGTMRAELRAEMADLRADLLDKMRSDFRTIMFALLTFWLTNLAATVGVVAAFR